ncbi:MAG: Rpn family recombination-promoting nuclease/putative transposase [Jaaginema sp. PMC 1079.18]|nr:Rpn family recombination-promoting nuclease/putative transposase [Jaaginema sp. PMC 1080.18]MEC4851628.1 Rpn family recombination-promoting nuclease/putative transposase [Jaaginema sp. PMC 1079.18]MEC4867552.1 Rpn family recombination-promoting nuclease/putative transposase [Jaaginema sp. PMC 1078.18]
MFDNVCRYLSEHFSADIASWLLGESIVLTRLSPTELSLQPLRADALILLQSERVVLHVEFQTQPDAEMPFRMADYRLRVYRRFPQKTMRQVVVYLRQSTSPLVYQTQFALPNLRHEFEVIRLWEQPVDLFLNTPGLLPFAVLAQTSDRATTLQTVAAQVDRIGDRRQQNDLAASAGILAGLVLEKALIQRLLRTELMRESVIYQDIFQQGEARGRVEGEAKGRVEGEARGQVEGEARGKIAVAKNLLKLDMGIAQIAEVTGLTVEQVSQLQSE